MRRGMPESNAPEHRTRLFLGMLALREASRSSGDTGGPSNPVVQNLDNEAHCGGRPSQAGALQLFNRSGSPKYAWLASFPPDLWPAEEEETADGIYLRLKDGTRLVGEEFSWRKNRNVAG